MRSDTYTIVFTTIVTVVLGLGLSVTADRLRDRQSINEQLDIKKNILSVLGFGQSNDWTNDKVQSLYEQNINEFIVDKTGSIISAVESSDLNKYTIYQSRENDKVTGYAIPIAGKGLWGTMYGYFAIEPDAETVKGITFYRHKETPGLGAEVDKEWFQNNFVGKKLVDTNGSLVSVEVVKGYVSSTDPKAMHKVDGISGATITGKGLTTFLKNDLQKYEPYLAKVRKLNQIESL
jgi:Na+-transporting NADH:ubiquinone oxidoreductase subunit C